MLSFTESFKNKDLENLKSFPLNGTSVQAINAIIFKRR